MDDERNGDAGERPKWPWLIRCQALYWFLVLQGDCFTIVQWDSFENWLFADERHLAAYGLLHETWQMSRKLKGVDDPHLSGGPE